MIGASLHDSDQGGLRRPALGAPAFAIPARNGVLSG
jgi:hypothetical protein